jgi:hypothetical protein
VRAVDLHGIGASARLLAARRGRQLHQLVHRVVGEGDHVDLVRRNGRYEQRSPFRSVDAGNLAVVDELDGQLGAGGVHGVGETGQAGEVAVVAEPGFAP